MTRSLTGDAQFHSRKESKLCLQTNSEKSRKNKGEEKKWNAGLLKKAVDDEEDFKRDRTRRRCDVGG
jgi:ribonucleotide reductase beta subunit family protein with ferritin-like domain